MFKIVLMFTTFFISFGRADAKVFPTAIEIELRALSSRAELTSILYFSFEKNTCGLKTSQGGSKKILPASVCKNLVTALEDLLSQDHPPSEYIHPHLDYYEVIVKKPAPEWKRVVAKKRFGYCDANGKCTQVTIPPASKIAELLLKNLGS